MNVRGLQRLMAENLPVMRNTFLFRNLGEIPEGHMDAYGDETRWALRGFDARQEITDHPYLIREARAVHGFSRRDLKKQFKIVNKGLDKLGANDKIFFVCEVFKNEDVEFAGMAMKDRQTIYIDGLFGNRPSRRDWKPDFSFAVPVSRGKPQTYYIDDNFKYRQQMLRICEDLLRFQEIVQVDFSCLKDGYLFYHDLLVSNK